MTGVDVKAERSLGAADYFRQELLFPLGGRVATSEVIGRVLRPRPPSPRGWRAACG